MADSRTVDKTQQALALLGFAELTPIQKAMGTRLADRKSVVAIAATGTGKTHGFLLPGFALLDPQLKATQMVVLAPTRELSLQILRFARAIKGVYGLSASMFVGGRDIGEDIKACQQNPQVVIGTPTRLLALVEQGALNVKQVAVLVVDEADMTFDLGFAEQVVKLVVRIPNEAVRALVAATLNPPLANQLKRIVGGAEVIREGNVWKNPLVEHVLLKTPHANPDQAVTALLKATNPYSYVVFANTRKQAETINAALVKEGRQTVLLHGELPVRERKAAFKRAADGAIPGIVATDLASRGLDIKGLSTVISVGLPEDIVWYAHRSGRTGRAGVAGRSFVLESEKERKTVDKIRQKGVTFMRGRLDERNVLTVLPPAKDKRRRTVMDATEIAIRKAIATHDFKVRPGYKKNLREKIKKIKQAGRRDRIEESVRHQLEIKWKKESAAKRRKLERDQAGRK